MPSSSYDALIVGGGHNGLVAAFYLQRAGLRTLVLERRGVVGGPCSNYEWFPGYSHSFSNSPGSLEPRVAMDMELERFGLRYNRPDPSVLMPFEDGRAFAGWRDRAQLRAELRKFSEHDARAYFEVLDYYMAFARGLGVSIFEPPPSIAQLAARITTPELEEAFGKIILGSIKDLLDEWLETEQVKAVLASLSLGSVQAGPWTPGTAYALLRRPMSLVSMAALSSGDPRTEPLRGSTGLPVGGMGAITQAMARSIQARGAEIRTETEVSQILTRDDRVCGAVLASGEEIHAPIVLSNLNPKTTFLSLLEPHALPPEFRARVEKLVMRGSQFKVMLALDALPRFAAAGSDEEAAAYAGCQFRIAPTLEYMERAHDDAKFGRPSAAPMIWGLTPSAVDDTVTPPGKHLMSLNVYHAPYTLAEGTWAEEKDRYGKRCIDVLTAYIPNLKESIIDYAFWSPEDVANEFGLVESNIMHGDMLPGRMFGFRPLPGAAGYSTPVPGLYLCGSGTWPGGTVTGAPGHNASQQVLRHLKEAGSAAGLAALSVEAG